MTELDEAIENVSFKTVQHIRNIKLFLTECAPHAKSLGAHAE